MAERTTTAPSFPRYVHIYLPILVLLWIALWLDSATVAARIPNNQWLANLLIFGCYLWTLRCASRVVRKMMVIGLFVGTLGEVFFSLVLGMYTYRLDNVPLYVPIGHTLLFAGIVYLVREPAVRRHRQRIFAMLYPAMFLYALGWLIFADDLFGFCCTLGTLWLLRLRFGNSLFFLLMFYLVINIELVGTAFGCWQWPPVWFGQYDWMPSANPPTGIGIFYFGFELLCLWLYELLNPAALRKLVVWRQLHRAQSAQ